MTGISGLLSQWIRYGQFALEHAKTFLRGIGARLRQEKGMALKNKVLILKGKEWRLQFVKKLISVLLAMVLCLQALPALADNPFEGMRYYEEGQYKVGLDFVAGEYVALSTSKWSGYFCVSSDSLGRDILFNEVFDVNSIFTVRNGEYIELSRCVAVLAEDFYKEYSIKTDNYGVMLKVGYDIRPGEYRLTAQPGETGYYCIYNDSRHDDIIANDLFENRSYITLRSGQYVILERCRIEQ